MAILSRPALLARAVLSEAAVGPETFLCALGDLADGKALPFELGAPEDPLRIVVVRSGETVRGYRNSCPHFQIPLDVGRGVNTFRHHLLCANHYAVFRFEDGYCIDGPCLGGRLVPVPVVVREDSIYAVFP